MDYQGFSTDMPHDQMRYDLLTQDAMRSVVRKALEKVQKDVEDVCLRDGTWYADYRRIRVDAIKL